MNKDGPGHKLSEKANDGDGEEVRPKELSLLRAREKPLDLTSDLRKTRIVSVGGSVEGKPGFHCKECNCTLMDSLNYLDHINGARHQQNLGMSMRVERSTPEQVRRRIAEIKRRRNNPQVEESFEEKIRRIQLQELEERKARKREKKESKRKEAERLADEASSFIDKECAEIMGFGGFGKA